MNEKLEIQEDIPVSENTIIVYAVNIFCGERLLKRNAGFKVFLLKKEEEKDFLEEIKKKILDIKKRETIDYFNANIEEDKIITFKSDEILTWTNMKNEIKKNTPPLKNWDGTVNILIYEVFTNIGVFYLITYYQHNSILKKHKFSVFGLNDEPHIVNNQKIPHIILDLNIHTLINNNELFAVNLAKTEEIFNFNDYYDEEIKKELTNLKKILDITDTTIKCKKDKQCLLYGIKTGYITQYINMPLKEKKIIIKEFQSAYKAKEKKEIKIEMEKHKISFDGLSAKEKTHIYKLISNKAGMKILTKTLATTLE